MNFNFTEQPEYQLNISLIDEVINLYGVLTKFLIIEKINRDDIVFGDYSHIKSDSSKIFDVYMLPETSESYDSQGYDFSNFGLLNLDAINLFVSRKSITTIFGNDIDETNGFGSIIGNILVLPNNKLMEITDIELMVPGINNLFTYTDTKSVYKLSCKPYNSKLIQELDSVDISSESDTPYETLDTYFNELIGISQNQDIEAEVTPQVDTIEKTGQIDNIIQRPIIDKTEDDVFGAFS